MKAIIEIDEKKGCIDCPYSNFVDRYDSYRLEDRDEMPFYNKDNDDYEEFVYCNKSKKVICNEHRHHIEIPSWCEFKKN